jgi:hypothetical protein
MIDQATSLLVNSQLPEFVREEHPNFIAFLEAYYEYLENKQGTQLNDLVKQSKQARYFTDVDTSVSDFEENFFNTYANLFPQDVEVDKSVLLKHVLPLYLAKGNEKSFKLLFRLLYNEEVEVLRPKTNVLKLSSGNWLIENIFRSSQEVYSTYTGNGTEKTFYFSDRGYITGASDSPAHTNYLPRTNNPLQIDVSVFNGVFTTQFFFKFF